ncbi:hypothetical protein JCM8208_001307 [Rhodotorula glutinis]
MSLLHASAPAALLSPDSLQPTERLDSASIYRRIDAHRAATIATLEAALTTLDALKRDLVIAIHRRFVALQKQHRQALCALAQANDQRELAEHHAKSALSTFLARLAHSFSALFNGAPPPYTPLVAAPTPEHALILVDLAEPAHALDMGALQDRVRAHEEAHRDTLEGIYAGLDVLFEGVAAAVVSGFERRDEQGRAALEREMGRCAVAEERNEEDRQSIATLVESVRRAFDAFVAMQQAHAAA